MLETYRLIWGLLDRRHRNRLVLVTLLSIVMSVFEVLGIAIILPFLGVLSRPEVIETNPGLILFVQILGLQNHRQVFIALAIVVLAVIVIGMLVRAAVTYLQFRFSLNLSYTLSERLLRGYLAQDYVWFLGRHSADLQRALLIEVDMVIREGVLPAILVLSNIFIAALIAALIFVVQPWVALGAVVLLLGIYGAIYLALRPQLSRIGRLRTETMQARARVVQEMMGGMKELQLLGLETESVRRFRIPTRALARYQTLSLMIGRLPRFALEAVIYGGFVAMVLGMILLRGDRMEELVPLFGLIGMAGLKLFPALQQIFQQLSQIRFAEDGFRKICAQIEDVSGARTDPVGAGGPPLHLTRDLVLDAVHFRYPGAERTSFEGLSLRLPARSTIGVVGGTGAGKTTLIDLILGLLHPNQGQILIDGTPLTRDRIRAWQKSIGYVPQQIFLLDDTVAANIAFGLEPSQIDRQAVERAARVANLHEFITTDLPEGYDTRVGERGVRLSGGQRQRIGIARALYHDPDVLILDEATSALDNLTERAVMEAVHNIGSRKTVIMIAHRLTTVEDCDVILMLERGRLVARGTYAELVADNETFRRMAGE